MGIESSTDMIAGIPSEEYMAMLNDPAAMEECAAQKCSRAYIIGLELGTMVAKASEMQGPDFDREAWERQNRELEVRSHQVVNEKAIEGDSAAWEWAIRASAYGIDAGVHQPMQKFEVKGGLV